VIKFTDDLVGVADCLHSSDDNSNLTIALGYYDGTANSQGIGSETPVWCSYGFKFRPLNPTASGTYQCVYVNDGDKKRIVAGRDNRINDLLALPVLNEGEVMVYGPTGSFVRMHADGSASMFVTAGGDTRSSFIKLTPAGEYTLSTPHVVQTSGGSGWHMRHSSGARIDAGAVGGLSSPLDAVSSYVTITAGMISLQASAVSLGLDSGGSNAAAVEALKTFIDALVSAIATITTLTNGAAAMVPISAALPALHTALNNLGKVS
jgi:hypothetical protein